MCGYVCGAAFVLSHVVVFRILAHSFFVAVPGLDVTEWQCHESHDID